MIAFKKLALANSEIAYGELALAVLTIMVFTTGFVLGKISVEYQAHASPQTQCTNQINPQFFSEPGKVTGYITSISGNSATIYNRKNMVRTLTVDQNVQITKYPEGSSTPVTTYGIAEIAVSKKAIIELQLENCTQKVVSIDFLPTIN